MYIMPHLLDRKHQLETYSKIKSSQQSFIIVQSPTGSGKSAWAAQLAADGYKVLVLVKTKSLQAQYAENYGFSLLYGKNNYTCLNRKLQDEMLFLTNRNDYEEPTADLCDCEDKEWCRANCPYPQARQEFIQAQAGVLNYSKFLLDKNLVEQFEPDYLILDECHELSDTTVDYAGIEFSWSSWIKEYVQPYYIDSPQNIAFYQGKEFLQQFRDNLNANKAALPKNGGSVKKYRFWENTLSKVNNALSLMSSSEVWYITSDNERFLAKPLTARFDFTNLFNLAPKVVLMSATIGLPNLYCRELGISEFNFIDVPNMWPPMSRIIDDLKTPKMGMKASREEWLKHSQLIADYINKCPDGSTGLIHSPSKRLAYDLADNMSRMTDRPIHLPQENVGTEQVADDWMSVTNSGTVGVFWNLWEGLDAGKDQFCIVSKVPFIDFGSPFDVARFRYDGKAGYQRIANKMVQGLGRIRRGKKEHYGAGVKRTAIADGNWKRLRGYISKDILDSIF